MSISTAATYLKSAADSVTYFNTVSIGMEFDYDKTKDTDYPICHIAPTESEFDSSVARVTFMIVSLDKPLENESDILTKIYATHDALATVVGNYVNKASDYNIELPIQIEMLRQSTENTLCGWRAFVTIETNEPYSVC